MPESTAVPISTSLFDRSPSVATDGEDNSVVVWTRFALPRVEVVARRFDPQGKPLGGLLQVTANGSLPTVAMSSRGNFVVAWLDALVTKPGAGYPMRVQLFAANGARIGRTTQLNTPVETPASRPVIGIDDNGDFAVTWSSRSGVFLRRFDRKGAPLGPQALVDSNAYDSSLAMQPDGSFILMRHALGLLARRYDADGVPAGEDVQINQTAVNSTQSLTVAATQDGGFVAAWDVCDTSAHAVSSAIVVLPAPAPRPPLPGPTPRGPSACDILARRFDATDQPVSGEIAVSPRDGRGNNFPVVAAQNGRGYFAISWRSCLQDCRISTQLYSPKSEPAPQVATASIGFDVTTPAIAVSPTGFVVAFSSSACSHFFPGCHPTTPRGIYLWRFDFP